MVANLAIFPCIGNWIGKVMSDMETRKENSEDQMRLYLYSAVRPEYFNCVPVIEIQEAPLP